MIKKNKKADSKLISVYWFAILVIVAGGIVAMVFLFYGPAYDVREIESTILAENVANCVAPSGKIHSELFDGVHGVFLEQFKDTFMERCSLDFEIQDNWEVPQYYVEVEFYNEMEDLDSVFTLVGGNPNWKGDCFLKEGNKKSDEKLVFCVEKKFYASTDSGGAKDKWYFVKITSMVRKTEKNA